MAGGSNTFFDGVLKSITGYEKDAPLDTKASLQWLKASAEGLVDPKKNNIQEAHRFPTKIEKQFITSKLGVAAVGRMMMYSYDPKWKAKLPYYDTFPLIILVGFTEDGWTGLNLHYLPPLVRVRIIEELSDILNSTKINETKKIQLSYNMLLSATSYDVVKQCFKRYLASHVRSKFFFVDPQDWKKAVMLPTERFQKKSATTVHRNFTSNRLKKRT
jgi:hypothetical protein